MDPGSPLRGVRDDGMKTFQDRSLARCERRRSITGTLFPIGRCWHRGLPVSGVLLTARINSILTFVIPGPARTRFAPEPGIHFNLRTSEASSKWIPDRRCAASGMTA
jgi:hypothetical protein